MAYTFNFLFCINMKSNKIYISVYVFLFGNGCVAKTRKEAQKMAISDNISAAKARIEELKKIVVDQRTRKEEYAEIISHQSEGIFFCVLYCSVLRMFIYSLVSTIIFSLL